MLFHVFFYLASTMVAVIVKNALYRVFLPASLIVGKFLFCFLIYNVILAALVRPSLLSAVYALLALSNPLFPRIRSSFPLSSMFYFVVHNHTYNL